MGKSVLFFSMSLDGFIAGPQVDVKNPLGKGGERLHQWMFENVSPANAQMLREPAERVGAVIVGRRTFDVGVDLWGDTPYPVPSFVVTHEKRDPQPMKSARFVFVDDGIESALAQARAAAGDKDIIVMGANTAQQMLKAGLADEIVLQIVPVLLGAGSRLFDYIGNQPIELKTTRVLESAAVTHMTFEIAK
ncbi:dihydrofolate reductase [Phyllobacterium sp. 628]|uniref:dihydrofolate reductase family protein n=1 Tax=Phyllobacterium sp. 628 TaxID=2718938 RepID=UPI0016626147|nr:dihydrofolate reductase family protein [Phyllobacterium sp. 628]QND52040.1 dihydrofolate reductase [Phyllobacterium sp. 628]